AHRGGVIAPDAPENSRTAIERAADHGYAMAELDVMETRDGIPVLLHDGLYINCGVRARVADLTTAELTAIRYRASEEPILTLEQALDICAEHDLGVMLDKLANDAAPNGEMSEACLKRVATLLSDRFLASSTVSIIDSSWRRKHLARVASFPIPKGDVALALAGESLPVKDEFWFGWAAELDDRTVARFQALGTFLIVSINTFHYPHHAVEPLAQADIERLLAAGVEGFQIDSVFEPFFPPEVKRA
ncbi:MAG: glycerophosphodiester phosphodiesterase family protein, partial [Candidatus Hydrogenedentes bacterium]|nr:glycerophosphodiester phosphodiesterase family protein [Candidatus Hydrogenedentota bacterium]